MAQAIPMHSISLFNLRKVLCNDINSILTKNWWEQTSNEKNIHWTNWKRLCDQKNKGGMGFRDIKAFNLAMLGSSHGG